MELSIILNTIKLDIWNIHSDINKTKYIDQYTLNNLYEINNLILHVYEYLENLKEKIKIGKIKNFDIKIIEDIVKRIEYKIKTIKSNIPENVLLNENNIDSFTNYMDFVINNGYINFNDYEKHV